MTWWHRLWHKEQMEAQLDKEMQFHLDQHISELIAQGHDPTEARRQARLSLGGPELVKENCRDARGTRWLEDVFQDVRFALRMLRKNPGFAAIALLTLALGTGATTVMFTVVNGVLLRPLPYAEPSKLFVLAEKTEQATRFGNLWAFAYPNYLDCQRESHSLAIAAWRGDGGAIREPDRAEYADARQISANLFSVLGVSVERGREFSSDDDRIGAAPVVIISHELWQRLFGGSASAVGSQIIYSSKAATIVGILPPGFQLEGTADVFTPIGQDPTPSMQRRDRHPGIQVFARLQPGAAPTQARAELALIGRDLAKQFPASNQGRSFIVDPLRPDVGDIGSTLWLLLGAVSLVLLIACTNVANLLLARAVSREREFAMRAALGAKRSRLVRQCLTESAVLGLSGGALGVLIAAVGIRPFVAFWPGSLPRTQEIHLDWRVLLFTLGISLLSGLLFGLAPALRIPARNVEQMLRGGARKLTGGSRHLHGSFVISEIALALVLLVSAGILGRTLLRLASIDPGLKLHNVLTARLDLPPSTFESPARIRATWQEVLDHARRVPGVEAVAMVDTIPMRIGNNQLSFATTPSQASAKDLPVALATSVSPDYLNVMGIPLLRGRFFDDHDLQSSGYVVVIDDVMAKLAFGGEDPIGKRIWLPNTDTPFTSGTAGPDVAQVIGVVGHVRHWGPASDDDAKVRAQFYYPFAQVADPLMRRWSELMSVAARTSISPLNLIDPLQKEIRGTSGDQVFNEIRTMEQLADASLAQQHMLMLLFGGFATLALLLACIGVYGVLAYLTSRRVSEIGVRMALGATPANVVLLILRQSIWMVCIGVCVGIAGAIAAGRLLERFVAGVRSLEPLTFAMMVFVLILAALFASYVPARRASRIDPMRALRQE